MVFEGYLTRSAPQKYSTKRYYWNKSVPAICLNSLAKQQSTTTINNNVLTLMHNPAIPCAAILFTSLMLQQVAHAEDRIDLVTETPIPRSKNLYGVGVAVLPETSGAESYRVLALPIINANYGDRFYINALQAGVWLLDSDDKRLRFGLSAQARIGWDDKNARITRGMNERDFSVDMGPAIRWQTDYGTFNANWGVDVGGASNGHTVDFQYIKNLYRGSTFKLNSSLGLTWNNGKFNDYYFGVGADETGPQRPAYRAGPGTELRISLNGSYQLSDESYLLFGGALTRLGSAQADSPIVETRMQPFTYVGYSMAF